MTTAEPAKVVVQRGLWFEEFETGVVYQHRPGRTITEADNVLFTTLTMNTQALHLDAAFSDNLPPFNQRLVNSMFTLSTLVGLSVAQLTQGTIVAQPRVLRDRLPQAAFPRRHDVCRDGGRRQAGIQEPARRGHRDLRAHRPQPARRRRSHRGAQDPGPEEAGGRANESTGSPTRASAATAD